MNLILLIDDDEILRETLIDIINFLGYSPTIKQAANGKEGLALIDEALPDIIFVDAQMPVMDGYDVALALQTHPARDEFVLCGMSGAGSSEPRISVMKALCDAWLPKPISIESVTAVLNQFSS